MSPDPLADRRVVLGALVAAFVTSRAVYYLLGVRFDVAALEYSTQLVDPEVLTDRLVESIWYLHVQPPGWNLLVGAVLRGSPFPDVISLQLLYAALGLVLVLALYDLARQLGLGRRAALVTAVAIGCGPTAVLYENWLAYEFPIAVAVVLIAVALGRWARDGRLSALAAVTGLAAACVLSRSLLHPVWFLGVVTVALLARRPATWTRLAVVTLAVPTLLIGGVVVKNQILFDSPQLSSLFGFNLYNVTVAPLPADVRERLRSDGVLDAPELPPACSPTRPAVPVLAEEFKRARLGLVDPQRNFNYECLLGYYEALGDDALAAARARPGATARTVIGSFEVWAGPATFYNGLAPNRRQIDRVETLYRRSVMLDLSWDPWVAAPAAWPFPAQASDQRFHLSVTIVVGTAAVLAAGLVVLARWRRDGLDPVRAVVLMAAGTVGFVTTVGNLFEHGENNRIRYLVEPLTLVVAAAVAAAGWRAWRTRSRSASREFDQGAEVDLGAGEVPALDRHQLTRPDRWRRAARRS